MIVAAPSGYAPPHSRLKPIIAGGVRYHPGNDNPPQPAVSPSSKSTGTRQCALRALTTPDAGWSELAGRIPGGYHLSPAAYRALPQSTRQQPTRVATVLDHAGRVEAVIPLNLGHTRIRRVPFAAWMPPDDPDRPVTDLLCSASVNPPTLWKPLAECLVSAAPQVSLLAIDRVEGDSRLWRMLEAVPPERKTLQPAGVVYKIPTGRGVEQVLAAASPKFRSNLRRRWRILGGYDFTVADTPTAVATALESFLVLEASGWKAREPTGNAILLRPAFATHVRHYISAAAAAGCCSIYQLLANGLCAAALIALRGASEVYIFKIAYDESMAQASPAHLLLERCLAVWCADPSLTTCNGGPEAPWLRPWRPVEHRLWTAYIGLGTVKAQAALALLRLPTLGALLGRSP